MRIARLSKFPITAPDGTKFLIKFKEDYEFIVGHSLIVTLSMPRKRFGYREVYRQTLFSGDYDRDNINYIEMTAAAVDDYYECIAETEERKRQKIAAKARRVIARDEFNAWDGQIKEESR